MEIGTIGAGAFAQAFAKRALKVGHKVRLSNHRGPASLQEIVHQLGPGATAASKEEAAACEMVLLAVSLGQRARNACEPSQMEQSDSD
jgi:predicted dinucleotide-binding enzyme